MSLDRSVHRTDAAREAGRMKSAQSDRSERPATHGGRQPWRKPTLENVSGKVMAQPYIRFT